jgi:hypothetical protein
MPEQKKPPSQKMRHQIDELLENGIGGQDNLLGALLQLGVQLIVQEALEQETTKRLGRARYQHRQPGEPLCGYRNGYEVGRLFCFCAPLVRRHRTGHDLPPAAKVPAQVAPARGVGQNPD